MQNNSLVPSKKFDIATKVLMDRAGEKIIETFLGLKVQEFEFIEELRV